MKRPACAEGGEKRQGYGGDQAVDADVDGTIVARQPQPVVEVGEQLGKARLARAERKEVLVQVRAVGQVRALPLPIDELAAAEGGRVVERHSRERFLNHGSNINQTCIRGANQQSLQCARAMRASLIDQITCDSRYCRPNSRAMAS